MEMHRSTKYRSVGLDAKSSSKPKRPPMGDRHRSAPLIPRISHGQPKFPLRNTSVSLQDPGHRLDTSTKSTGHSTTNLVVLGYPRVGKTTFIRNALDTMATPLSGLFSGGLNFESQSRHIMLCELRVDDVEIVNNQSLKWPNPVGDEYFQTIDGVICMYDVTNESSITNIPRVLYALGRSKIPVVLVANKSDVPISEQEVGIAFIERITRSFPLVIVDETSAQSVESAKKCLHAVIKATLAIKKLKEASEGDADDENFTNEPEVVNPRTTDLQLISDLLAEPLSLRLELVPNPSMEEVHHVNQSPEIANPSTASSYLNCVTIQAQIQQMETAVTDADSTSPSGEEHLAELPNQLTAHIDPVSPKVGTSSEHKETGVPFLDLVERLLRMPATKNEAKFVPAFLCLYRAFATPRRLLAEIINRFDQTDQSNLVPFAKTAELLRYLQVLTHWTANYPGDFVEPATRRKAISFAHDIEHNKNFGHAVREIFGNLLTIIMDDDHDWAYEDNDDHDGIILIKSAPSTMTLGRTNSNQSAESEPSEDEKAARRRSIRNSGTGSAASSIMRSSVTSSQSATNLFNLENAREQSRLFKSVPDNPLTKTQWHQFMSIPNEELAQEITRVDWTMYSAIRTRDFIRHVSLPSQKRAKLKHADTIGMMVKHFNHLALFVSGMILLRDKPKHRAKTLEKFMDLAWKVRQLNNYNSLGAIIAGVTGPEITRLRQTHELVPAEVQKQFLRLTILMSISRSHAAYRMAWENSFSERIPFIPLIRQDLTMTAHANPTFIGENINWKKFEIMGDVIVSVQKSQEQSYSFSEKTPRCLEATRLILETKVIEDSEESADPRCELYERSIQLESSIGGDARKSAIGSGVKRTVTGWF